MFYQTTELDNLKTGYHGPIRSYSKELETSNFPSYLSWTKLKTRLDNNQTNEEIVSPPNKIILTSSNANYDVLSRPHNGQISITYPKEIHIPYSEAQIMESAISTLSKGMQMSIRCGGHSYIGASSCNDVILSLQCIKGLRYFDINTQTTNKSFLNYTTNQNPGKPITLLSKELGDLSKKIKGVCLVSGGCRLGEVYYALIKDGACFPGGVCPTVGIGGFLLGGGEGLLQRKYGLGCQSVIGVKILVQNNNQFKYIYVTDNLNNDNNLMKAIRGGGQANFGIIVEFLLAVYPIENVYAKVSMRWPVRKKNKKNWRTDIWNAFQTAAVETDLTINFSNYYAYYVPNQLIHDKLIPGKLKTVIIEGQYSGVDIQNKTTQNIIKKIKEDLSPLTKLISTAPEWQFHIVHAVDYTNGISPFNKYKEYLRMPLIWAGLETNNPLETQIDNLLKITSAYNTSRNNPGGNSEGNIFPQESFSMLNDHFGSKNNAGINQTISCKDSDRLIKLLEQFFTNLENKGVYPGWVGFKWDMSAGKCWEPNFDNVTFMEDIFATSQLMYYFVTGQGGGGGVSGIKNLDVIEQDKQTQEIFDETLILHHKLTPIVNGTLYVNYPLDYIQNSLESYYGNYIYLLENLKNKYDPYNFWFQPQSLRIYGGNTTKSKTMKGRIWRSDGHCGFGAPTVYKADVFCPFNQVNSICSANKCISNKTENINIFAKNFSKRVVSLPDSVKFKIWNQEKRTDKFLIPFIVASIIVFIIVLVLLILFINKKKS